MALIARSMSEKAPSTGAFPARLSYRQDFDLNPQETRFRKDTERDDVLSHALLPSPCIRVKEIRPEFESLRTDSQE